MTDHVKSWNRGYWGFGRPLNESHIDRVHREAGEAARAKSNADWLNSFPSGSTGFVPAGFTSVGSSEGDFAGSVGCLALLTPALIPPLLCIWRMWDYLDNAGWTAWPKIGACVGVIIGLVILVKTFFKFTPVVLAGLITGSYMAVTYGAAAMWLDFHQLWTGIVVVAAGTVGYWIGGALSENFWGHKLKFAAELTFALAGILLLLCGRKFVMADGGSMSYSATGWIDRELPWAAITLIAIGTCAVINRFPWVLLVALAGGVAMWIKAPGVIQAAFALVQ